MFFLFSLFFVCVSFFFFFHIPPPPPTFKPFVFNNATVAEKRNGIKCKMDCKKQAALWAFKKESNANKKSAGMSIEIGGQLAKGTNTRRGRRRQTERRSVSSLFDLAFRRRPENAAVAVVVVSMPSRYNTANHSGIERQHRPRQPSACCHSTSFQFFFPSICHFLYLFAVVPPSNGSRAISYSYQIK